MSKLDLEELKARLEDRFDPDEIVDILGLSTRDILDKFEDRVLEKIDEWSGVDNPE